MNKKYVSNTFRNCKVDDFIISSLDIKESVKDLKQGTCAGLDNLSSEHYINMLVMTWVYFFHLFLAV